MIQNMSQNNTRAMAERRKIRKVFSAVDVPRASVVPLDDCGTDSSEYDTDLEDAVSGPKEAIITDADGTTNRLPRDKNKNNHGISHVTYTDTCEQLGVLPFRSVLDQLGLHNMQLQHVHMNQNDAKALACALWSNTAVENLLLEDNGLSGEDLVPIINVLKTNCMIANLSLSENDLDTVGAMTIDDILRKTSCLVHLNLSGTKIGDKEMDFIASGIQNNNSLRWMDLSHNKVSIEGAKKLGTAIGKNTSLQFLDLSWNHIRMQGAVGLCKGLKKNNSILNLNLSMNGLGFEGSLAMDEALQENRCLKFLDISNNRINWEGVSFVARGLKKNRTLQMLKIGSNPINMEGCYEIVKAASSPKSQMQHIGLENIPVNGAVLVVVDNIRKLRPFTISHGGILDTRDIVGIRKEKPEDPISLVVRYLSLSGLRIIDLFRMSDSHNEGLLSKANFVRGCKRVGVPLGDRELAVIASRLHRDKHGYISYSTLSKGVRGHIREERKEDRRQEVKKRNKLEERRRILKTELPPIQKRNYEDDLSVFYKSSGNFGSIARADSIASLQSNSLTNFTTLPSIAGSETSTPATRPTKAFSASGSMLSSFVTEIEGVEHEPRDEQTDKSIDFEKGDSVTEKGSLYNASQVLKYINKYLYRRKTEVKLASMLTIKIEDHN